MSTHFSKFLTTLPNPPIAPVSKALNIVPQCHLYTPSPSEETSFMDVPFLKPTFNVLHIQYSWFNVRTTFVCNLNYHSKVLGKLLDVNTTQKILMFLHTSTKKMFKK